MKRAPPSACSSALRHPSAQRTRCAASSVVILRATSTWSVSLPMWMDARKRCKEMGPATRSVSLRHATSTRSQGAQATANSVLSAATSGCAATAPATRSAQIRPATTMRRLSTCALMLRTAHQHRRAPRQRTGTTGMTPTTTIAHTPHVCGTVTTACVPEHLIATQISMCFLHPTPVWRP